MAEDIGSLFPTKIPTYEESADIKEAIRLYHYGAPSGTGTGEYNPNNTDPTNVVRNSVAGEFKFLNAEIADIRLSGFGSTYSDTAPTAMPNDDALVNGFVWMKSDSSASVINGTVAIYQTATPSTGLVNGLLWVDKTTMTLKVYDAADAQWKAVN